MSSQLFQPFPKTEGKKTFPWLEFEKQNKQKDP